MHGEGNGTPLQYFGLENPMGGGAWWAAIHGVTQSRTRLKRLSSSSSSSKLCKKKTFLDLISTCDSLLKCNETSIFKTNCDR